MSERRRTKWRRAVASWCAAAATLAALHAPAHAGEESAPAPDAPVVTNATLGEAPWSIRRLTSRHSVEVGYFGHNFTHPGGVIGYSYRALQTETRRAALVVGLDVGSYHWARNEIGVFVLPRVGFRGRHRVGLQGEVNLHFGYLQGMLAAPAYTVDNGRVESASRAGYPYFVIGPTVGVGWHIASIGITPFARVGAFWQTPSFDATLLRFMSTFGVEVSL